MTKGLKINLQCGYDYSIVIISFGSNVLSKDIVSFLSSYRFSRFKRGKYILKRLLSKIINKQLDQQMIWKNDFWTKIKVEKIEVTIKYNKENSNQIIENFLNDNQSPKRMKNIIYYNSLIKDNIDLGYPLYIMGDCLNILVNESVAASDLFQVDGSRRLWANMLNEKKKMYFWLISKK
jgi:hypothetical protein